MLIEIRQGKMKKLKNVAQSNNDFFHEQVSQTETADFSDSQKKLN